MKNVYEIVYVEPTFGHDPHAGYTASGDRFWFLTNMAASGSEHIIETIRTYEGMEKFGITTQAFAANLARLPCHIALYVRGRVELVGSQVLVHRYFDSQEGLSSFWRHYDSLKEKYRNERI